MVEIYLLLNGLEHMLQTNISFKVTPCQVQNSEITENMSKLIFSVSVSTEVIYVPRMCMFLDLQENLRRYFKIIAYIQG